MVATSIRAGVLLTPSSSEFGRTVARRIQAFASLAAVRRTADLRAVLSCVFFIAMAFSTLADAVPATLVGTCANGAVSTAPPVVTDTGSIVALSIVVTIVQTVLSLAPRTNPESVAVAQSGSRVTLSMSSACKWASVQRAIFSLPSVVAQAGAVVTDSLSGTVVGTQTYRAILSREQAMASAYV